MIPAKNTRVHEAGHAVLLASCGHPLLHLHEVHVVQSDTAAGGCMLRGWWAEDDAGFHPGPDAAADATLALMAFGGMAAEIAVFGERPKRGWYDDLLNAALRLALLSGASAHFVKKIAARLDDAVEDESLTHALCSRLGQAVHTMSGAHLGAGLQALEAEAVRRAGASVEAIAALAEELERRERVPATDVQAVLSREVWCGFLGPHPIPGFHEGS